MREEYERGMAEMAPSAVALAKWWGAFLREGTGTDATQEVRNLGDVGPIANSLLGRLRESKQRDWTPEMLDSFEFHLADRLDERLGWAKLRAERDPGRDVVVWTQVDYNPDQDLHDASEKAGIDISFVLPLKSRARILNDRVEVSLGDERWKTIWEANDASELG